MRQKITVFRLAVLADCFLCTGGCAAMAVVRLCVAGISGADAGMRVVAVRSPCAPIVPENVTECEGRFLRRTLGAQTADCAGLVIDFLFGTGCSRLQILRLCFFSREAVCRHLAVFAAAGLADSSVLAVSCAAGAVARFRVSGISGADAGMCAVTVGRPRAPVMVQDVSGEEGRFLRRTLGAQTADGAGLVINRFLRAGGGGFQILFRCRFFRETVGC